MQTRLSNLRSAAIVVVALAMITGVISCSSDSDPVAPNPPTPTPDPVIVTVQPTSVSVEVSQTQPFTATVTGVADTLVTWSVEEGDSWGTIDAAGLYTAPSAVPNPAVATIRATSVAVDTASSVAAVAITGPPGWVAQTSGTTSRLNDVFFTDANTGTAVGSLGTILRTTDGGSQ